MVRNRTSHRVSAVRGKANWPQPRKKWAIRSVTILKTLGEIDGLGEVPYTWLRCFLAWFLKQARLPDASGSSSCRIVRLPRPLGTKPEPYLGPSPPLAPTMSNRLGTRVGESNSGWGIQTRVGVSNAGRAGGSSARADASQWQVASLTLIRKNVFY